MLKLVDSPTAVGALGSSPREVRKTFSMVLLEDCLSVFQYDISQQVYEASREMVLVCQHSYDLLARSEHRSTGSNPVCFAKFCKS